MSTGKPRGVVHERQDEPVSCFTCGLGRPSALHLHYVQDPRTADTRCPSPSQRKRLSLLSAKFFQHPPMPVFLDLLAGV
ncbi:hypothetical protein PoB_006011300 [Plakobranchus ocellatus]|uniref:Uncharacterized protein n=1 Tax=Plakobranchus ocellatus TaxID=259542 RepID=A0AAV4CNY7_9GAST|nr:hypothetical protein PoB_006011300 [Plakobranchus ocellatus]